ncbi:hypothetical protein C0Q70_07080 [Pomacea canaliculata]|uniref:Sulfatase N-terminal domain-containing protein n=2 Tax=Pomacea canaliculata TaxID=400727 RepID=A0A2T7PE16_POMCA|nr:hypothetical protein C0Q70_07080 [Pomacea canaliculata]
MMLLPLLSLVFAVGVSAQNKNVLLVVAEDAGVLGEYGKGVTMPNLNAIGNRSVVFRYGFSSSSSSSPSRSAILTGLPPHQNGMYGLAHSIHHYSSFRNVQSLSTILSAKGIHTGVVGEKRMSPDTVYRFDFEATEDQYDADQIGRNITVMKEAIRTFLSSRNDKSFFLYFSYYDAHRCSRQKYGQFCEEFGDGGRNNGLIPDWTPVTFGPNDVNVPYYLPNTAVTRQELANMYKSFSRMDQALGIVIRELSEANLLDNTLIIVTSATAISFPAAKNNLYEPSTRQPFMISSPFHKENWGFVSDAMVSGLDLFPTILEWFNVPYPDTSRLLTGRSLLPLTVDPRNSSLFDHVFASHNSDEVTAYYPMRSVRTPHYRLIHNLNSGAPFPIASDVFQSPTFTELLNNTNNGRTTHWYKSLGQYYNRDELELYDLQIDPMETTNVANDPSYSAVVKQLLEQLVSWQNVTRDPWLCRPEGSIVNSRCVADGNGLALV